MKNGEAKVFYVVKTGDTLSGLALRFLSNSEHWHQIAFENHLPGDVIYPGQRLEITLPVSAMMISGWFVERRVKLIRRLLVTGRRMNDDRRRG